MYLWPPWVVQNLPSGDSFTPQVFEFDNFENSTYIYITQPPSEYYSLSSTSTSSMIIHLRHSPRHPHSLHTTTLCIEFNSTPPLKFQLYITPLIKRLLQLSLCLAISGNMCFQQQGWQGQGSNQQTL